MRRIMKLKDNHNPFIVRIPLPVLTALDKSEKLVYIAVLSYSDNGKGACYCGYRALGKRSSTSPSTALRAVKTLINKGYLQITGTMETRGGSTDIIRTKRFKYEDNRIKNNSKRFTGITKTIKETIKETEILQVKNINPKTTKEARSAIRKKFYW